MAKNPEQVAKVGKKSSGSDAEPQSEGSHPWSMASKIAAGLFATIIAPLIVALILKVLDPAPAPVPAQPNASHAPGDAKLGAPGEATSGAQPKNPDDGFVPIFNGTDFSGWKVAKDSRWSIDLKNHALAGHDPDSVRDPETHWIWTAKEYSDFRLRFEFRYEGSSVGGVGMRTFRPGEQSGDRLRIQLMCADHPRASEFPTGIVGIWSGDARRPVAKPLTTRVQLPTGRWNRAMIEFRGPRLRMWVNRSLVQDTQGEADSITKPQAAAEKAKAPIGLQVMIGKVEFRGLQIEELAPGDQ